MEDIGLVFELVNLGVDGGKAALEGFHSGLKVRHDMHELG